MVTQQDFDDCVREVLEYWSEVPRGCYELARLDEPWETVITVTPGDSMACPISYRIGREGTFDVYVATGLPFPDIPFSKQLVRDLSDAVRLGQVRERVWRWRGTVVRADGEVAVGHETWRVSNASHWAGFLRLGRSEEVRYVAY